MFAFKPNSAWTVITRTLTSRVIIPLKKVTPMEQDYIFNYFYIVSILSKLDIKKGNYSATMILK